MTKMKFPDGRGGGDPFCKQILENPDRMGVIGKIPSVGGMDIFWNYTYIMYTESSIFRCYDQSRINSSDTQCRQPSVWSVNLTRFLAKRLFSRG